MKGIKRWIINWLFDGDPPLLQSGIPENLCGFSIQNNNIAEGCEIINSKIVLEVKNLYLNGEALGKMKLVITPDEVFRENKIKHTMARPTRPQKPETLYRQKHTKAVYRKTYQCPAGAGRAGIPKDDLTDLCSMELVRGPEGSAVCPTISEYELRTNFEAFEFPQVDTPESNAKEVTA